MKRVATGLGLVGFLMLLMGTSLSAQVGERPRDSDYTEDAEDAIDDAEDTEDEAEKEAYYRIALQNAQDEITENPNNPLGHRLAALASLGLAEYAEAGAFFDKAAELYPLYEFEDQQLRQSTWIDLYNQASPLVSAGDYEGAVAIFEDAHAVFKDRPEIMITVAQLYGSLGEYEKSLDFMGQIDGFMASETAAVADSATMAGWQEQSAVLPVLKAQVLAADGQYDAAADAYRGLVAAEPDNSTHLRSLAQVFMDGGRDAEALEVYEQLLVQPGLDGETIFAIGVGFYSASDYVNAVEAFGKAADLHRTDRDALEMWARSLLLDELFADIPAVAERWVELDPFSQNGWLIWAQAANQAGDTEATQEAMGVAQDLEVSVDQLQMQRFPRGGASVSGSVINKTLEEGTPVSVVFTFYDDDDAPLGTVSASVTVGGADMAELVDAQFDSAEMVWGYSYELTIG
jgi:tetratricopeptide (TPR) repeat protein